MSVDAGGELAEEVDVFVFVGVPEATPLAAGDAQRKRFVIEHRPRVAAGHDRRRLRKAVTTARVASDISGGLVGQRARQRIGGIRGTDIDSRTDRDLVHDDELYPHRSCQTLIARLHIQRSGRSTMIGCTWKSAAMWSAASASASARKHGGSVETVRSTSAARPAHKTTVLPPSASGSHRLATPFHPLAVTSVHSGPSSIRTFLGRGTVCQTCSIASALNRSRRPPTAMV